MEHIPDKELNSYIKLLTTNQKQSLLEMIKSSLNQEDTERSSGRYTEKELSAFYDSREKYLKGQSKWLSVEQARHLIRQDRNKK